MEQHSADCDRVAQNDETGTPKVRQKQKYPDCRRFRSRKNKRICETVTYANAVFICSDWSQGKCETFQSEKDWHISTESLFIVMKLVRVGELNAWIVEWRGNALKGYSNTPAGMEMSKHWNVRSPVKSAERYRNNSSWRKLSRGGWCILYAGSL